MIVPGQRNVHTWLKWRETHGKPRPRTHIVLTVPIDSEREKEVHQLMRLLSTI